MKAIFEFTLPEEIEEFERFNQANDMSSALSEFANYMRSMSKYDDSLNESQYDLLEKLREKYYEILNDNKIEI